MSARGHHCLQGPPTILMYHRVAVERSDPWGLCVSPRNFAEQLDVLSTHASVLPLAQLQRRIGDGTAAPGSVAITFDDGYADNLLAAAPLLARLALPATVFVTTGYSDQGREFWWDELDRILLEPGVLPAVLEVEIAGTPHRLDLGRSSHYLAAEAGRHDSWRAYVSEPPTERHAAYLATWERLVALPDADRWTALCALAVAAGGGQAPRRARRQLSVAEIEALANGGLVDIGAHTVTHPALPLFTGAVQRWEIRESGRSLEEILGRPVPGFSYPHGQFTDETVRLVRDAGFTHACAATPGPHTASGDPDPFRLGRLMVPDLDGDAFLEWLLERPHG